MNKKIVSELCIIVLVVSMEISVSNTESSDGKKYEIIWDKTFGGPQEDFARSIIETNDGGFVFASNTKSFGIGNNDILVININSNGVEKWNTTFGTVNDDIPTCVVTTDDGGFLITGTSINLNSNSVKGLFAKISSDGVILWNKTLGKSNNNQISSIIRTKDGGYLLVGVTNSFDTSSNMWLIKTDETGSELWNKTYGGPSFQKAWDVVNTKDDGFVMVGWTGLHSNIEIANDVWLLKTDNIGNELWNRSFGEIYSGDLAEELIETSDGGLLLGGITNSPTISSGSNDAWLIKTDKNGHEKWNKTYGGSNQDYTNALLETSDGGFLVSIHTFSGPNYSGDNLILKINKDGKQEWNQSEGYTIGDDFAYDMIPTADNAYVLAGQKYSNSTSEADAWVFKINLTSSNSSHTNTPNFTVSTIILTVTVYFIYKRRLMKKLK